MFLGAFLCSLFEARQWRWFDKRLFSPALPNRPGMESLSERAGLAFVGTFAVAGAVAGPVLGAVPLLHVPLS